MVFHVSLKNQKADCNTNQQNHEGSSSEVHSQQIGFTLEQVHSEVVNIFGNFCHFCLNTI